ncbi:MAG: hypothetical protein WBD99_11585 [Thermodesulfobacteriota bacterium]
MVETISSQNSSQQSTSNKARKRSPNYPALSLPDALTRAEQIYKHDDLQSVPIALLPSRWKLKETSGYINQIVAALSAYGLINVKGQKEKRHISISEHAKRIFENADDKQKLIERAALEPNVNKTIWDKYKNIGLPNDDILERNLVLGEGFNFSFKRKGAKLLVRNLKETLKYALLTSKDKNNIITQDSKLNEKEMNVEYNLEVDKNEENLSQTGKLHGSVMKSFHFPLIGAVATISIPHPMSEKNFRLLTKILDVMKDALVEEVNKDSTSETT